MSQTCGSTVRGRDPQARKPKLFRRQCPHRPYHYYPSGESVARSLNGSSRVYLFSEQHAVMVKHQETGMSSEQCPETADDADTEVGKHTNTLFQAKAQQLLVSNWLQLHCAGIQSGGVLDSQGSSAITRTAKPQLAFSSLHTLPVRGPQALPPYLGMQRFPHVACVSCRRSTRGIPGRCVALGPVTRIHELLGSIPLGCYQLLGRACPILHNIGHPARIRVQIQYH